MARGKNKCRILKEIRRQIAEANDIEFITSECRYKGDCLGTCPKCEAELRYLEEQLRARSLAGKAVVLAGISTGMFLMSGCGGASTSTPSQATPTPEAPSATEQVETTVENLQNKDTSEGVKSVKQRLEIDDDIVKAGESPDNPRSAEKACANSEEGIEDIIAPNNDEHIYGMSPEVEPRFPGGDAALLKWVNEHLRYPQSAKDSLLEGRVVVNFVIEKNGSIGEIKIVRSHSHSAFNEEAVRVVKSLPRFYPGSFNGVPKSFWYTLPIRFKLPEEPQSK